MMSFGQRSERHWIVCESGQRFSQMVWRLAADWIGSDESLVVVNSDAKEVVPLTRRLNGGIVLWELSSSREVEVVQSLTNFDPDGRSWLKIVASGSLTLHDQSALSELGVAAIIRHPEELSRLQRLVVSFGGYRG